MTERKPEPPPKADNPEQSRRFIDMAREVEADESPGALDRAFKRVVPRPEGERRQSPAPSAATKGRPRRGQSH